MKCLSAITLAAAMPLLLPAASLATPQNGYYTGHTKQQRAISLTVNAAAGGVGNIKYKWRAECDDGVSRIFSTTLKGPYAVNDQDGFRAKRATRQGTSVVRGHFIESGYVKGSLAERRKLPGSEVRCSATARFTLSVQPR
jgi:hypothetical protein